MTKFLRVLVLAGIVQTAYAATIAVEIGIQPIGTKHTTSFPPLLLVHLANPGYTAMDLAKMLLGSQMIIDGKPSHRKAIPYNGRLAGLPPMGEWDGCLSFQDFEPMITPGKHLVSLQVGNSRSAEIKLRWTEPLDWHKGNLKSRKKEIQELAAVLVDGLPRTCVEQWLTVKDGGLQEEDKVRYFLEPQFKATVPYRQMYETSGLHSVVDGPVQVYQEAHATD